MDTSGSLRDVNVPPLGDPSLDLGVTPRLVFNVRQALDSAWESWDLAHTQEEMAKAYCRNVQIVVTGGFNPEKIERFEKLGVPADIYGVGSSLLANDTSIFPIIWLKPDIPLYCPAEISLPVSTNSGSPRPSSSKPYSS